MKAKELELSEKIERRLEVIYAHTKLGKTIQEVIKKFGVCRDTYYYWYHRYEEMGIFGLFDSKRGPKTPCNKASDAVASRVIETADYPPELDAADILEVLDCSSVYKPSVATAQRILRLKGRNHPHDDIQKKRRRKRGQ